jgi:hypothetical protein
MPQRLDVFLVVLGLTLPMLPLATVRAGSLAMVSDRADPAEGGAVAASRTDLVRLWQSRHDWSRSDDWLPGIGLGLVPGDAMLLLERAGQARRSWPRADDWDVPVTGSLLVGGLDLIALPLNQFDGWGTGEPLARTTLGQHSSSDGADPFVCCILRHDDRGIAGRSAGFDARRLCFFLVIASAAGVWMVRTHPMPAVPCDQNASRLAPGDEAVLESPGSKSTWASLDRETLDAMINAEERNDLEEVAFLLARKRLIPIRNGTRVEVLGPPDTSIKVYIRNGPHRGVEAWVQCDFIRRTRARPRYGLSSFDSASHAAPASRGGVKRGVWALLLPGGPKLGRQEQREEPVIFGGLTDATQAGAPETITGKAGYEFGRG